MNRDEELKNLKNAQIIINKIMLNIINKISVIEREIIEEKQVGCEHDFKYVGHGHNDDYYKCEKCNFGEWR